jgi:hypothetical protein
MIQINIYPIQGRDGNWVKVHIEVEGAKISGEAPSHLEGVDWAFAKIKEFYESDGFFNQNVEGN